ncbi:uncharacterized protein TRAVEDRAFT_25378 [Trametes versicolor FP-101664 SS1]|uniref:uncharacterized protein n=1 Tax=Trametes versicolor (strain FP-101664) TaxID=717944 RepID=UPI00046229FD|nr:uncharacterized protein TRAVEDRAFT_25378 [Trametes versicolor FP-101664 SS1]EIW64065.1 hypothetical protein TRAVEDRAFT_25378 [Trametes versicolor FP-101664 SS1]
MLLFSGLYRLRSNKYKGRRRPVLKVVSPRRNRLSLPAHRQSQPSPQSPPCANTSHSPSPLSPLMSRQTFEDHPRGTPPANAAALRKAGTRRHQQQHP